MAARDEIERSLNERALERERGRIAWKATKRARQAQAMSERLRLGLRIQDVARQLGRPDHPELDVVYRRNVLGQTSSFIAEELQTSVACIDKRRQRGAALVLARFPELEVTLKNHLLQGRAQP